MLQIEQSGNQPGRQGRTAAPGSEGSAKAALDLSPVDQACPVHERVARVDLLTQARAEQILALGDRWLGSHGKRCQ